MKIAELNKIDILNGYYLSMIENNSVEISELELCVFRIYATRDSRLHDAVYRQSLDALHNLLLTHLAGERLMILPHGTSLYVCVDSAAIADEKDNLTKDGMKLLDKIGGCLANFPLMHVELSVCSEVVNDGFDKLEKQPSFLSGGFLNQLSGANIKYAS